VDYETLADLRYRIRRFRRVREETARAATIGALTERLQIRHHATVQLVDRLAQPGMVVRRRAKLDRRGVVIELTARGEAVLCKLALNSLTELRTAGPALAATLTRVIELDGCNRPRTPKSKEARDS
jgi:DNA-binding MarR family transcriptional regulator